MIRRILLFTLVSFTCARHLEAQQKPGVANSVSVSSTGTGKFYYASHNEPARAIEFKPGAVSISSFLTNINQYFNIPAEFTFREAESNTDNLGMKHRLMRQYYKGVVMEGMGYRIHEKNGFVTSANGRAVRGAHPEMQVRLSEEQAYHLATAHLHTKDTTVTNGLTLIVSKGFTFTPESFSIAYQFDIGVSFIEKWRISIDARSGEVINKVSLVNSCHDEPAQPLPYGTGTGKTSYYGNQTIRVEELDNGSRLRGETLHGGQIGTYDFQNAPAIMLQLFFQYSRAYDVGSSDKNYNLPYQQAAVSAQWATEHAYEYYFLKHNRNSYDNLGSEIKTYVHVDSRMDNAYWINNLLAIGDGDNNNPLVELDVIGHELTHGVTQFEAGLQYYNESGALNESFSDIMGKAIEFDTFGDTATWQIARHHRPGGFRDMKNPNLQGQPDTYGGDLWHTGGDDNGGVHYNSGVQNFWFYLLCEGGAGVNDHQLSYAVNPVGIDVATRIVYRNLTEYLSSFSDYLDARIGSLLAASDLYGSSSGTYNEVDKAWDAVGVIDEPSINSLSVYDITATTVAIKGSLIPRSVGATYRFEYGSTPALGTSTTEYSYTDKVEAVLTGLQSQTKYYLKLVATNEHGSTPRSLEFTTISLAPLARIKQTVDVTETTATVYGQINPNSLSTSFYFEYGTTLALGQITPSFQLTGTTEFLDVSASVTGLQPRQTYYYRLIATNSFASASTQAVNFYTAVSPIIISLTPIVATVGDEITLTGKNFNTLPEKNLVNFGATRATVLSSTPTEVKVKVPAGASFGPLSLVDAESGLAAKSVQEFVPTFTAEFKKSNIRLAMGFNDAQVYKTYVEDMDGDGKPDIVADHYAGFSVFQNVCQQGDDISSESFVRDTHNMTDFSELSLADLNGDGRKEVIGQFSGGLRILPNLSVPGYIFFGPPVDVPLESFSYPVFEDFDMDGHIDIAGIKFLPSGTQMFSIIRNQNPTGSLAAENFDLRSVSVVSVYIDLLTASDVNNDGSPDVLFGSYNSNALYILKNNSHQGVFDFEENVIPDPTSGRFARYLAHDLNDDGWKDIIAHSPSENGNLSIFTNTRTSPTITLKEPAVALSDYTEFFTRPGDIDGDGKTDLLVAIKQRQFLFLKNKGTSGDDLSPSTFENFATYGMSTANSGTVETRMSINDLNGDGRPEIINANTYYYGPHDGYQMEIWQNKPDTCLDASLTTIAVSNYTATISLPRNTTLDQFEIDYTPADYIYWQRLSSTTINYLSPGGNYKLRVRAQCYLGFTDYYYINFTTDCVSTSSFAIDAISVDYIHISADDLGSFEVQYSPSGQELWSTVPQYANQITNLLPGTRYDLRFRGRCYESANYTYKSFTTLCPRMTTLGITELAFNRALLGWSSDYSGDALLEYSDDNVMWTSIDKTLTLFPLVPATRYYVRGSMVCADTLSAYLLTQFTTPCPKVSTISYDELTPYSARVSWVDESNTGSYVLTYSITGGRSATVETHSTSFNLSELEPGTQYSVSIVPECSGAANTTSSTFSTICYAPFNLSASNLTFTTAELSWSDDFGDLPYAIDYSILDSKAWKTTEASIAHVSLSQLRPGTKYEARVHIACRSVTAPYVSVYFETDLYEETTFSPNPTDSKITIYPSSNLIGSRFSLYDNMGRVLAHGELVDYTIDLSTFAYGIYTLQIEGEKPMRIVRK